MEAPLTTLAEHAARGELAYQVDATGQPVWPPSVRGVAWRISAGLGTVYATTTIRRPGEDPYDLTLVDLDEGFRMMSTVRGGGQIGARVRAVFEEGIAVFEVDR